ncbi:hypothetical protein MUK70_12465 [Dyadobacter chenwenxiniae]|uniref:Uncharacterized protein n=1 Tax=Dyadobacter chenwenxiniae TaxID=2906456 RepID=A0A9X1TBN8_9BACT|nr:hypothetical protein [Dyadobacter chenwenxiniae]MCF0060056.1 hypothetical protein [Dyadobacter chenwenxiniae]UON85796.1 hypothetical protein MUK70_12465 [Dyadobacter chenwenxiniae]
MKTFLLMFYINLMIGCYQQNLGPKGNVVQDGSEGYWKLTNYKVKSNSVALSNVPNMFLLQTRQEVMQKDSLEVPIYSKGMPYIIFSFYDNTIGNVSSVQAIQYDHEYNKKSEQSKFWYRIDQESGFLTILDVKPDNRKTTRIEVSNVIKSAAYNAASDSVRYIYEPTEKFK